MHNIRKGGSKRGEGRKSEQRAGARRIKGSIPHNTTIKFYKQNIDIYIVFYITYAIQYVLSIFM